MDVQVPAVATRSSQLAIVQAEAVRDAVMAANPGLELNLLEVSTRGDRIPDVSLETVEGTGFFTDAIEEALLAGRAVLGAHSLKDVPVEVGGAFEIAAVLQREDPLDVVVSPYGGLDELPRGARVGTDASRRREQLALIRPDLAFESVRGNVPTRLRKLDAGEYDALVLAAAGLKRLGLADRITERLAPDRCLPAPGQGAIAIEALRGGEWAVRARRADDPDTAAAVRAERAFLAALGGGCQLPVGALARVEADRVVLHGVVVEGGRSLRVVVEGPVEHAVDVGAQAARRVGAR